TIAFSRQIPLTIAVDRPPVTLIARPLEPGRPDASMVLLDRAPSLPPGTTPAWPSEPAARLYHWRAGDRIALPLGRGEPWVVAGIWRDYSRQQGAVVVASRDYDRLTGDTTRNEAAVMLAPGASAAAVARALALRTPALLRPMLTTAEPGVLRRFALRLFDRSFAVTYLLEGVAIVVGLAGVAATMSAQTIARTREFGMLRHIGVSRRQIVAMLASEGALLGLLGALAGVLLGAVIAQVLIHVINPQSFNWTMDTRLPLGTIGGVIVALVAAAAGTAVVAGRRAVAIDAVHAVREDW
ncbi:MAG: FtsX-like permease family protein, partial [Janthinobacterium lividum]